MLEGVTLENGKVYVADMKAKLIALNTHIREQNGFVTNSFTTCAQDCVDGLKPRLNDNTLTEACKVQEALHFIAVKLEPKLLRMQRDIDQTIYKDDAHVKQELKILLEEIDNGFDYFWAASAEQYIEHVVYNLQKLYNKVSTTKKKVYWKQNINTYLSRVRALETQRKDWSTWKSIPELNKKVEDYMLDHIRPRLVASMDYINEDTANYEFAHGLPPSVPARWNSAYHMQNRDKSYVKAEWNTAYNFNLLHRIIAYMDRAITTPGVKPGWTPNPIHVSHFLPGKRHALLDGEGGGRRDMTELLQQLLELSV
jgi:hypothetical protein